MVRALRCINGVIFPPSSRPRREVGTEREFGLTLRE
jgi:hypothetical protein